MGEAQLLKSEDVEGVQAGRVVLVEIYGQDPDQHQHRAGERVKKKLDGGVKFSGTAPDSDQEIHRNQHDLPKHVENEEVERHENAEHSRLQQEHECVVFFDSLLDRIPGGENRDEPQKRGQKDHQNADSVDAKLVFGSDQRNPVRLEHEAKP